MNPIEVTRFTKKQDKDTKSFRRWKFNALVNVPVGASKKKKVTGVIIKNKSLNIVSLYAIRKGKMRLMYCTDPAPTANNTQVGKAIFAASE